MLSPNDNVRMIVELLRLSGGSGAELVRRWVAALLNVPEEERGAVVEAVEARLAEEYDLPRLFGSAQPDEEPLLHISEEARQRDGYTEVLVHSYEPAKRNRKQNEGRRKGGSSTSA